MVKEKNEGEGELHNINTTQLRFGGNHTFTTEIYAYIVCICITLEPNLLFHYWDVVDKIF